jgi:hypothetical protein
MKPYQSKPDSNSQVICLGTDAFLQLIDETVTYVKKTHGLSYENRWVQADEAKKILGISSSTSLQKLRDEGRIRYSQPMHKVILYDRESLMEYINDHVRNTF